MPLPARNPPVSSLAIKAGLALHRALSATPYALTWKDKAEQLRISHLPSLCMMVVVLLIGAWIASGSGELLASAVWLFLSLGLCVGRHLHAALRLARPPRLKPPDGPRNWQRVVIEYLVLMAMSALGWAIYAVHFLPALDTVGRVTMLNILACTATMITVRLSVMPRYANLFAVLLIAPASMVMIQSDQGDGHIASAALVYLLVLVGWAHLSEQRLVAAIGLSRLNERLVIDAVSQQKKVEFLNAELRDAQDSLLQLNQQLEERVRQRTSLLRREISEREGYQKRLENLANSDPLTGLSNRSRLGATIALELDAALEKNARVAVYFIDLDRFKEVNDGMGHYTGDRVLEEVSARLLATAPDASCVARWGGDEFVIVQPARESDDATLEAFAQAIVTAVSEPIRIGNVKASVGASVGIAVFPEHGKDPESLIKHADLAVYQAKLDGRGCVKLFRPDWQHKARERIQMVQALKDAIENDTLTLNYQPILDPTTGAVSAMEALLRWRHHEFGVVSPAVFVALAEESGLMVSLGNWVLRQACRDARHIVGPHCERVAVNVSAHQFAHGDFLTVLEQAMQESGLSPDNLEIELTETVYAHDANQVRETLQTIRRRGVYIAIDDFGTGYSSLAYLQRFPVDVLKVDRSFVRDLGSGGDTIIGAVTSLARSLGVRVVVEGIETVEQLVQVRNLGADQVQGFLFAKPMETGAAIAWLKKNEAISERIPEPVFELPYIVRG